MSLPHLNTKTSRNSFDYHYLDYIRGGSIWCSGIPARLPNRLGSWTTSDYLVFICKTRIQIGTMAHLIQ